MNKLLLMCALWLASVCAGCNSDVFVDGPLMPQEQTLTVDGDGGSQSLKIDKGLKYLGVNLYDSQSGGFSYFNAAGEMIPADSPARDVARIAFDDGFAQFSIYLNGKEITVKSVCNPLGKRFYTVWLDYGYTMRYLLVNIAAGEPLEMVAAHYVEELNITDKARTQTRSMIYENGGDNTLEAYLAPYDDAPVVGRMELDSFSSWADDGEYTLALPMWSDGKWQLKDFQGLRSGEEVRMSRPGKVEDVKITVPPHTRMRVYTYVYYTLAVTNGTMTFRNAVTGEETPAWFTVSTYYPMSYNVQTEILD